MEVVIKYLKTGKYALHHCEGPIVDAVKDEEKTLTVAQANRIIQDGWAEKVKDVSSEKESGDEKKKDEVKIELPKTKKEVSEFLSELIKGSESEADAKKKIQDWGNIHVGTTADLTLTVKKMISQLCEAFVKE